ncbi:membrane protein [Mycobacterium phage ScoobyDoobyDoo]|nr:membrane protein [Mycobacterium phage ScoobyDoobyDoo]
MKWLVAVLLGILTFVLFAPLILPKRGAGAGRGRGDAMETIARWVVLSLGRLSYWVLRGFENIGVDMGKIEDELARLNRNVAAKLSDAAAAVERAQAEAQRVKDEDAAEDAIQIREAVDAALAEAAAKIQEAADAVGDPAEPETAPGPVAEPVVPEADPGPTDPVSPVDPVGPTNPEDPSTAPDDAPDVSADEPVAADTPDEPAADGAAPDGTGR